jgi:hypothetical protein
MVEKARTIDGSIVGNVTQFLAESSPTDLREPNRRHAIITPYLAGVAAPSLAASARTIRRWLAQWRLAEQGHGCGYLGLLPKWRQRGNRNHKLPEATLALVDEFLIREYETLKQKRKFVVYAALQRACDERGLIAPSYPSFVRYVNHRPRQQQIARRQGPRAAAEAEPFYWELNLTTPRHGDRPFEIAHLDHTQLDVELGQVVFALSTSAVDDWNSVGLGIPSHSTLKRPATRIRWALSRCSSEPFINRRHHCRAAGRVADPVLCVEDDPIEVVSPVKEPAVSLPEVVGYHPRLRRLTFEKQQPCKSNPSSKLHRSHRRARAWRKQRGRTATATKGVSSHE